jgi:hypothetical protein
MMTPTEELVACLRDLETFKRMYPYEWEESIGYRELMARKADLLARIDAADHSPEST